MKSVPKKSRSDRWEGFVKRKSFFFFCCFGFVCRPIYACIAVCFVLLLFIGE